MLQKKWSGATTTDTFVTNILDSNNNLKLSEKSKHRLTTEAAPAACVAISLKRIEMRSSNSNDRHTSFNGSSSAMKQAFNMDESDIVQEGPAPRYVPLF